MMASLTVFRYRLDQATVLLNKLNVDIPQLPPFDPDKMETFDWEDKVKALIEQLKLKNQTS